MMFCVQSWSVLATQGRRRVSVVSSRQCSVVNTRLSQINSAALCYILLPNFRNKKGKEGRELICLRQAGAVAKLGNGSAKESERFVEKVKFSTAPKKTL